MRRRRVFCCRDGNPDSLERDQRTGWVSSSVNGRRVLQGSAARYRAIRAVVVDLNPLEMATEELRVGGGTVCVERFNMEWRFCLEVDLATPYCDDITDRHPLCTSW